jgi:hypothetical protein
MNEIAARSGNSQFVSASSGLLSARTVRAEDPELLTVAGLKLELATLGKPPKPKVKHGSGPYPVDVDRRTCRTSLG